MPIPQQQRDHTMRLHLRQLFIKVGVDWRSGTDAGGRPLTPAIKETILNNCIEAAINLVRENANANSSSKNR